jgi:hypothetical protein
MLPAVPLMVVVAGGIILAIMDVVDGNSSEDSRYLKLVAAVVTSIAFYLAFDRWTTVKRLQRLETGIMPSDVLGLSGPAYQRLMKAVRHYVQLYHVWKLGKRSRSKSADAIASFMDEHFDAVEHLSQGVFSVPEAQIAYAQGILSANFKNRFDAVSEGNLDNWSTPLWTEYHNIITRSVRDGAKVNRIFLVSMHELSAKLANILRRQHNAGIGWAVAIKEELNLLPAVTQLPRDFALLDGSRVVTFRNFRNARRRFEAIFNTPERSSEVGAQVELYEDLVGECWIVSPVFVENIKRFLTAEGRKRAQYKAIRSNEEVKLAHGFLPECTEPIAFLLVAGTEDEIQPKLDVLTEVIIKVHARRGHPNSLGALG